MVQSATSPTADKQRRYRQRLRSQGLRPVQIWVPDTRRAGFAAECRRQARRIARMAGEAELGTFILDLADWPDA